MKYGEFAKTHTIGLGFELLAVNNSNSRSLTSVESVRNLIANSIKNGGDEFIGTVIKPRKHKRSFKEIKNLIKQYKNP